MKRKLRKAANGKEAKRNRILFSFSVILIAVFLALPVLTGCGEKEPPPEKKKPVAKRAKPRKKQVSQKSESISDITTADEKKDLLSDKKDAEPLKVADAEIEEEYNPIGRRDPFQSFISRAGFEVESEIIEEDIVDISGAVLTKFQLRQLTLVGVLIGINDENIALVEDPTGKGYMVKVGTRIANGKVSEINLNEVIVVEKYKNFLGEIKVKENFIRLKKTGEAE